MAKATTRNCAAVLMLLVAPISPGAASQTLREQLEALAGTENFRLRGLEYIEPEPAAAPISGSAAEQLKVLLRNYNYFVTTPDGKPIREVVITSRLKPRPSLAPYQHVPTTKIGTHHQVEGILVGPNNVALSQPLIVDTGASAIVLPLSMTADLGFDPERLAEGIAHTAGGTVPMKVGYLNSVRIGNLSAANVLVNFIADDRLGDSRLLGMSFLDRFKVTIDDARKELILLHK